MMKSMRCGLVLVLLVSCMQSRDNSAVEVRGEDCSTCHVDDFDSTTLPPHRTNQFPTTCGDCHRTTDWQPALEGLHPLEPKFPLGAPHDNITCFGCHDLDLAPTSKEGANTNCVQCHPDTNDMRGGHAGAKSAQGVAYAYTPAVANFCFSCHPTGRLAPHPDREFPRTGPHDAYCVTCHDRTLGSDVDGMNATCINSGCHSLAEADKDHREEDANDYMKARGNGTSRNFCLESGCHPDGQED